MHDLDPEVVARRLSARAKAFLKLQVELLESCPSLPGTLALEVGERLYGRGSSPSSPGAFPYSASSASNASILPTIASIAATSMSGCFRR